MPFKLQSGRDLRAERTDIPVVVERLTAARARIFEPCSTGRTDKKFSTDGGLTFGAAQYERAKVYLDRTRFQLALVEIGERVRRPKEEIEQRAEERRYGAEKRRQSDLPTVDRARFRIAPDPPH